MFRTPTTGVVSQSAGAGVQRQRPLPGGGGLVLPPDNGFGLLSITTTQSGTFQAQTVIKTGAPLRWFWGDGTFTDGNVPSKVYPDNSEKTIYIATTDGWSGLTEFRFLFRNVIAADVSVATALALLHLNNNQLTTSPDVSANTALTQLYLNDNQLTTPPDVSSNTALRLLYLNDNQLTTSPDVSANTALALLILNNNQLTVAPDVSANTALTHLYLHYNQLTVAPDVSSNTALQLLYLNNNQLTVAPDVSANTALTRLYLNNNQLPQAQLDTLIDQCWQNRVALGGNSCDIRIQSNANPPGATAIAQIDGTGMYAGDGLIDNGCSVTY